MIGHQLRGERFLKEKRNSPPGSKRGLRLFWDFSGGPVAGSPPGKEFRIMIVQIIQNLKNKMELQINRLQTRIEKMQEMFNKDLEELKNKYTETNNTITETKNTLEGINSRTSEAEERISELEDKTVVITSEEQNKVKRMKITEESLRDLWDYIKCTNIRIIGIPEEEEKKKGYEKIFEEIVVENFPNMEKEIVN